MNKLLILTFLSFLTIQLNAQKDWLNDIEHGVVLSTSFDRYAVHYDGKSSTNEGGIYFLLNYTKKKIISADLKLGYSKTQFGYGQLVGYPEFGFFFQDSIEVKSRTGDVDFQNLTLSIPIKFRYKFRKKNSVFVMGGFNHNISLWKKMIWNYDEFIYDYSTWPDAYTPLTQNQEERLKSSIYRLDIFGGLGYTFNKIMIDLHFSGGLTRVNSIFIRNLTKTSFGINIYYRLN